MGLFGFLFGFKGRINRAKAWLFAVLAALVLMALLLAFYVYAMSFPGAYENGGPTPWPSDPLGIAGAVLWWLLLVALGVAGLAVAVKRLHDRNKTWWWILLFVLAPNLLLSAGQYILQTAEQPGDYPFVFHLAALGLVLWGFVELACLPGSAGDNRFGPDPLAKR